MRLGFGLSDRAWDFFFPDDLYNLLTIDAVIGGVQINAKRNL